MKKSIFVLVALTLNLSLSAQTTPPRYSYKLLKDSRSEMIIPNYTVTEKKIVLDQAYLVLNDIFVHRDLKLTSFGADIDPLPMIKKLQENVDQISDRALHRELIQIFQKQQDLHTSYILPEPYACFRSILPVAFKEVTKLDGSSTVAVSSITAIAEILALVPQLSLNIGDELIQYAGKDIEEAIQVNVPLSYGANPPAIRRRAISLFSYASQKNSLASVDDAVTMSLKNRKGQIYTVSVPWIARADNTCLKKDESPVQTLELATDDYQIEFNQIFRKPVTQTRPSSKSSKSITHDAFKETPEPTLKYRIVKNEYGDYGHIKLESFAPEKISVDQVVDEIRKILISFEKTDGLIIDLRDNGGGYIRLAHTLVQLFTPADEMQLLFKLKNSFGNRHYMTTSQPTDAFTIALEEANRRGEQYSLPLAFHGVGSLEKLGQYYFGPVAVFTNANCYSSCDMFSALMQDQGAAIIFGEDSTTGAGGANNSYQKDFVKSLKQDLGPFQKLPAGQDMMFAFRQSIRTGPSAGVLIENIGILSDKLAKTSISDLYSDSAEQFKTIGKALNEISTTKQSWVKIKDGLQELRKNEAATIFMQWHDTDHLIFKSRGSIQNELNVNPNNTAGSEIALPVTETSYHTGQFDILGLKDGKRVWRKKHHYRTIPEHSIIEQPTDLNSYFAFYRYGANDGWIWKNDELVSNEGELYKHDMKSHASLFLNLTKDLTLNFDAEIKTEKDYDNFQVLVRFDGMDNYLIPNLNGDIASKSYQFDLSSYKDKNIEIKFVIESDAATTDKGVKIKNIRLVAKDI